MKKIFNAETETGRANVAKATYAAIALGYLYYRATRKPKAPKQEPVFLEPPPKREEEPTFNEEDCTCEEHPPSGADQYKTPPPPLGPPPPKQPPTQVEQPKPKSIDAGKDSMEMQEKCKTAIPQLLSPEETRPSKKSQVSYEDRKEDPPEPPSYECS